jgi:hypothetical protein
LLITLFYYFGVFEFELKLDYKLYIYTHELS